MKKLWKKSAGNAGELMMSCLCILAMSAVMFMYIRCMGLIQQKVQAGQIARKYLLKMETCGYLPAEDSLALLSELERIGVTEIDLSGTTVTGVGYGQPLELRIRGRLGGEYEIIEYRTSTAKY